MLKTVLKCLLGLALLTASQACAPNVSVLAPQALGPDAIETAIAGTMAAAATQTAQSAVTATSTSTVAPTRTPSPTPFPTFTIVVAAPMVRVTRNTNCRLGPGEAYDSVGLLRAGEFAQAVGRSADGQFWIIHNPSRPSQLCWLSGKYATVTGVAGILPILTPPPLPKPTRTRVPATRTPQPAATPSPHFRASYAGLDTCTGTEWWLDIKLTNTGPVIFRSIFMILQDLNTGEMFTVSTDNFVNLNGCDLKIRDIIVPGDTKVASSPVLSYDPTGHDFIAGISLCSRPGQLGKCAIKIIEFTP